MNRILTVSSGKGGVGKTSISLNLAIQLARLGHKTCVFDADLGLANINILLGIHPEHDISDVIFHGKPLRDIIIRHDDGIDILPGSSGVQEVANLDAGQLEILLHTFAEIEAYDFLIFDTAAGISRNVIPFCLASSEVVVVISPEPTSLTDAYALLKVLSLNGFSGRIKVIVNQCKNAALAKTVYKKFKSAVNQYLDVNVAALGLIYLDDRVSEAVKQQRPLLTLFPEAKASQCIRNITERLLEEGPEDFAAADMMTFWRRCLTLISGPLKLPGAGRADAVYLKRKTEQAEESVAKASGGRAENGVNPDADEEKLSGVLTMNGPLVEMMAGLTDSITALTEELQLFRKAVEGNGNGFQTGSSASNDRVVTTGGKIKLDLEKFLKHRSAG